MRCSGSGSADRQPAATVATGHPHSPNDGVLPELHDGVGGNLSGVFIVITGKSNRDMSRASDNRNIGRLDCGQLPHRGCGDRHNSGWRDAGCQNANCHGDAK